MSVQCLSWVLEHSPARLGGRLTLIALANHAHEDGSNAFISQATIAREARLTDRQVRRCLKELEAAGAILREPCPTRRGVVVWRVNMSADNLSGVGSVHGQIVQAPRTNPAVRRSEMSDKPLRNRLNHPPLRPKGALPRRPKGNRRRDHAAYKDDLDRFISEELPELDDERAPAAVEQAIEQAGCKAPDEVRAFLGQHWPQLGVKDQSSADPPARAARRRRSVNGRADLPVHGEPLAVIGPDRPRITRL